MNTQYNHPNELKSRILCSAETRRVEELADKILLKENARLIPYLAKWTSEAHSWAEEMLDYYKSESQVGDKKETLESLCLLYLLNHYCPSLYHYFHMPSYALPAPEQSALARKIFCENTQVGLSDANGAIVQEGVHRTALSLNMFLSKLDAAIRIEEGKAPERLYKVILLDEVMKAAGPNAELEDVVRAEMSKLDIFDQAPFSHISMSDSGIVGALALTGITNDHLADGPVPFAVISVDPLSLCPTYLFPYTALSRMGWSEHDPIRNGEWWYAGGDIEPCGVAFGWVSKLTMSDSATTQPVVTQTLWDKHRLMNGLQPDAILQMDEVKEDILRNGQNGEGVSVIIDAEFIGLRHLPSENA